MAAVEGMVSVVVVNWNGRERLARCLPAVRRQTYRPFEILVVDNGSADGSAQLVAAEFPDVRLLRSPRNLGFAGGTNLGIRAARGEYVATLNNDAEPEPAWLAEMVRAAESSPRVGMVAAKMLLLRRPDVIDSAGFCLDRAGIAWDRRSGEADRGPEPLGGPVGPCAGAALYRRAMLEEVGLFDEDFFLYLEDVDLGWRARLAAWECAYAPAARVYHEHSASAGEDSPWKRYHLGRNKLWAIAKNYPAPQLYVYLPAVALYDTLAALAYLLAPPSPATPLASRLAAVRGRLAGLLGLPRTLGKRREVQRRRRLSGREEAALLAPLAPPWAVYRRYAHLGR